MNVFKIFSFLLILSGGVHEAQCTIQYPIKDLVLFTGKTLEAINEQVDRNDFPISKKDEKEIKDLANNFNIEKHLDSLPKVYSALTNWTQLYIADKGFRESDKNTSFKYTVLAEKSTKQYFKSFKDAIETNLKEFNPDQSTHIMDYPSEVCARFILNHLFHTEKLTFDEGRSLYMWQVINEWIENYLTNPKNSLLTRNSLLLANKMLFDKIFRHPDSILAQLTWVAIQLANINDVNRKRFLRDLNLNYSLLGGCYPGYRNRLVEYIFDKCKDIDQIITVRLKISQPVVPVKCEFGLLKNFYDLREPISEVEDESLNAYLLPVLYEAYYFSTNPNKFMQCRDIRSLCKVLSDCDNDEISTQSSDWIKEIIKDNLRGRSILPNSKLQIEEDEELARKIAEEEEIIRKDGEFARKLALEEGDFQDDSNDLESYLALNIANNYKPQYIEDDSEFTSDSEVNDDSDDEDLRRAIRESKLESTKLKKISSNPYKPEYKSNNEIFLEEPPYNNKYNYNDLFEDSYRSNIINDLPGLKQELINLKDTRNVDHLTNLLFICQEEDDSKVLESENRPACIKLALEILNSCESIVMDDLTSTDIHAILKFFTNNQLSDKSIADNILITQRNNNNLHLIAYNGADLKQYLNNLKKNYKEIASLRNVIYQYTEDLKGEGDKVLPDNLSSKSACMQKIVNILNNFPKSVIIDFEWRDIRDILNFLIGDEISSVIAEDAYLANQNYKSCRVATLYNQGKGYYSYNNEIGKLLKNKTVVNIFTKNIEKWEAKMIDHSLDAFINFIENIKIDHNFSSFDMFEILLQIRGGVRCDPSIAVDIWLYVVQYLL